MVSWTGAGAVIGILSARLFLSFYLVDTGAEADYLIGQSDDPCNEIVEWIGVNSCDGPWDHVSNVALGTIPGMPGPLNFLKSIFETTVLVWAIRELIGFS